LPEREGLIITAADVVLILFFLFQQWGFPRQNPWAVAIKAVSGVLSIAAHIFFPVAIENSLRRRHIDSSPSQLFLHLSSPLSPSIAMVDRRSDSEDGSRAKRQKMDKTETDPRDNPYLAHMYADESRSDGTLDKDSPFAKVKRHQTTAAQAKKIEDGDLNPFNNQPFSSKYFSILQTRRDLPVHAQRFVLTPCFLKATRLEFCLTAILKR
jgi:hypothetical protein